MPKVGSRQRSCCCSFESTQLWSSAISSYAGGVLTWQSPRTTTSSLPLATAEMLTSSFAASTFLKFISTAVQRTSIMSKIVIVGGSGKIAKLFSRLATSKTGAQITSLVRSRDHFDAISQMGATPQLLDIESAKVEELQQAFEGAQGVLFAAGAGGKGPKERTRNVDEEGAIKASLGMS